VIYKRGRIFWYKFVWQAKTIRESTRQSNGKTARQMEAAHRTALAKGEAGFREHKPAPTLIEFIDSRFEPWARANTAWKTWRDFYRVGVQAIRGYKALANLKLDEVTSEKAADFAADRRAQPSEISTVNGSLRVLSRILSLAVEWGVLETAPKIKKLPGERHREHVVTREEEALYLAAASEPLASVATVLIDSGQRPEECFRMRWEHINWLNGRQGTFLVTHGKTAAARRVLPMTPRVRFALEGRWKAAGEPSEGWAWPASTRSGHVEGSTFKKQHAKTLKLSGVRPFVLYSLRHTFLTRLGESGCDVWTLARVAGHSSIKISTRYVHPSGDAVLAAMSRLDEGGHNSGHNRNKLEQSEPSERLLPV
jgi:integrase